MLNFDVVLYHNHSEHQTFWIGCFAEGLKQHGIKPRVFGSVDKPHDADISVVWGVRNSHLMTGQTVVMERGYFGSRLKNISCGWNGLNGRADFKNNESPPDRWEQHGVDVLPWSTEGEYVLLMGQVQGDMATKGVDLLNWYSETAQYIRTHTDRPVVFRPHPLSRQYHQVPGCFTRNVDLNEALAGAFACVTYNSNAGVDSVLAGVPTVVSDPGAMAWDVASHEIDDLSYTPDRGQWLNDLAYCQWTEQEIRAGKAWEHLKYDINAGN